MAMTLSARFTVPLPVGESWTLLQDMDRVARWFPGATLGEAEGESFNGTVRVKLGPMVVDYRGTARFVERDEQAHRVVLEASGREQRGSGMAKAIAKTQLEPDGAGTAVTVSVDLDISGRPAQLGQGLMQDVAQRLVEEFSERMRAELESEQDRGRSAGRGSESRGAAPVEPAAGDSDVLDLGRLVGQDLVRRAAPLGTALLVLAVVVTYWLRRRARQEVRCHEDR
ncbi:MAG: SRPBCC family protein [Acidimicrobiales bacterium]